MKKLCFALMVALIIGLLPNIGNAQGSFKGYMIAEYYNVLKHHSGSADDGGIEGRHGFWFRRIYFTYNNNLSETVKMRLRIEMNSPGSLPFSSSSTLTPFVKDAYLSAKISGQELVAGIISPPTFGRTVEDFWGYRSLEKTPLDLLKIRSSRDFGIALKGSFDQGKVANYMVMYGNGSSNKAETNKHKIVYGALTFNPTENVVVEAYGDYESKPGDVSSYVLQGFGGFQGEWGRIGAQYSFYDLSMGETNYDYYIMSGFAIIRAAKDVELIARYDRMSGNGFDNNFAGQKIAYIPFAKNPGNAVNLFIGGFSWNATKNVWLIPNIKYVNYSHNGIANNVYGNLTLWFKF